VTEWRTLDVVAVGLQDRAPALGGRYIVLLHASGFLAYDDRQRAAALADDLGPVELGRCEFG
jgi:hypothetical protein